MYEVIDAAGTSDMFKEDGMASEQNHFKYSNCSYLRSRWIMNSF